MAREGLGRGERLGLSGNSNLCKLAKVKITSIYSTKGKPYTKLYKL